MKTLLSVALGAAIVSPEAQPVSTTAAQPAQTIVADCGPVRGTIAVANDAAITPGMARVSEADARAAALAAVPDATIDRIDLEEEDGFLVYDLDLTQGAAEIDVTVDAGSGAVLCTERD